MAKPKGLEHFNEYFKDYRSSFVLIGGAGLSVLMDDDKQKFRKTTDLDIVLLTLASDDFTNHLSQYVEDGGYRTKEASEESPKYYRFLEPTNDLFPEELEFFSNNETQIQLKSGQYIVPVNKTEGRKISAILLDDLYFNIIKTNIQVGERFSILNPIGQVCLKARAFREIRERKEDTKKSDKHRNDIVRISQLLDEKVTFVLTGYARTDFEVVLEEISQNVTEVAMQDITGDKKLKKADVIRALRKTFTD